MIESARFTNVSGYYVDLNDDKIPFEEFTTEVDVRQQDTDRSQDHGVWPGMAYLGVRKFHCNGDVLRNTSAEYWQSRLALVGALMPKAHLGFKVIGTLDITFTGMEPLSCQCTIDGYPELPLVALSPSAGKYSIHFRASDPRLYGVPQTISLVSPPITTLGRTYPKTYNYTYPGGTLQPTDIIVYSPGNVESYPYARIYGPTDNPRMTLIRYDGAQLSVAAEGLSLPNATDYVDFDFKARTAVKNNNQNVYRYTVGSKWWAIEPNGVPNIIRYSGTNILSGSNAIFTWRNAYMI